jgi:F-box protein 43
VKSFNKRFETVYKKTPTEEEFMDLLFRNHHLPNNPEFLIGRHMGLEQMDILSELNKRSLNDPLDKIFSYLSAADLVKVASVSRDWRQIVKQNKPANKKRADFIKEKKEIFETSKENNNSNQMSRLAERRNLFKRIKQLNSTDGSLVFASLDHNCLDAFTSEVKRAGKSLMQSIDNTYQKADESKRVQQAFKIVESSPKLISKRMSPYKSPRKSAANALKMMSLNGDVESKTTAATTGATGSNSNKIDLIGSKKSKRNLKRL